MIDHTFILFPSLFIFVLPEVISQYVSKEMCKIQALFIGTPKSELPYLLDILVSTMGSRALARDFLSSQKSLSLKNKKRENLE